jgi:hypothetical protein
MPGGTSGMSLRGPGKPQESRERFPNRTGRSEISVWCDRSEPAAEMVRRPGEALTAASLVLEGDRYAYALCRPPVPCHRLVRDAGAALS